MAIAFSLFSLPQAHAAVEGENPQLLADSLTPEQAANLDIVVPKNTDPGYHVLTVQVYDNNSVQSERHIYFCKTLSGEIRWTNVCPDLDPLATKSELSGLREFSSLPRYSPEQETAKNVGLISVAVALFLSLTSARRKFVESASATLVGLSADKKSGGLPIKSWGDRSFTWKFFGHKAIGTLFQRISTNTSTRSLIFARILGDGDYGRAMFGSLWVIQYLLAPLLGIFAAYKNGFLYAPPTMPFLLGMVAIGILDAFSGFLTGWAFLIATVAKNIPTSVEEVALLFAIAILCYAPVLIAAATRTFRRFTHNSNDRWDKFVDYVLAPTIGMWSAMKVIEGLNGFTGRQFLISYYSLSIGLFVGILTLLRMFIEEFSNRVYTWRNFTYKTEYLKQHRISRLCGLIVEIAIATYLSYKFSHWSYYLALALALGFFAKIVHLIFGEKIPKSKVVSFITPRGLFLTVALIYLTSTFHDYVRNYFANTQLFLLWWIVIAAVPAFLFGIMALFTSPEHVKPLRTRPVGKYFWRLASILIYVGLLLSIIGISPEQVSSWITQIDFVNFYQSARTGLGL